MTTAMQSTMYTPQVAPMYGAHQAPASSYGNPPSRPPCNSLEELKNAILADIAAAAKSSVPECTSSEISLSTSVWIPLHRPNIGPYSEGAEHDLPAEFKTSWTSSEGLGPKQRSHPQASGHAIINGADHHTRQTVQRAASRGIVAALEAADGFKYTFNNAWGAKDDDGLRFSYICQDSVQNKDRHANGFTRTQKHLKGEGDRGPRKPTFDCKGSISVKCSMQKQCIDVYYRHYAIHPTVKERKAARPSGPMLMEGYRAPKALTTPPAHGQTGGLFGKLKAQETAYSAPSKPSAMAEVDNNHASNIGRPLKRKRDDDDLPIPPTNPKSLSLAGLLKETKSATSFPKQPPPPNPTPKSSSLSPPMTYDLPSWQAPLPPEAKPPPQPHHTQTSNLPSSYHPPYQPPYQPSPNPPQPSPGTYLQPQKLPLPPKPAPHQGLFTTMKPLSKDPPQKWVPGQGFRPQESPVQPAAQQAGEYRSPYPESWSPGQERGVRPGVLPEASGRMGGRGRGGERQESPDPWFPKR